MNKFVKREILYTILSASKIALKLFEKLFKSLLLNLNIISEKIFTKYL